MGFFYKRETLIRSISLMALMAAINVIFSLLTNFIVFLGVALVIFLPLTSAIVEITCKDRYFPIYAFATVGLSIVVSLSSFDVTIFYVLPSIITGYIFGLMQKKNLPNLLSIFVASIAQTIISFAFIPLIQLITQRNLIDDIVRLFSINDRTYFDNLIILIFFIVGLIQTILSFIVIDNELKKMGVKKVQEKDWSFLTNSCIIGTSFLGVIFSFFYIPITYVCGGFAWYFAVFSFVFSIKRDEKLLPSLMGVTVLINCFLFAALNSYFKQGNEFLLFGIAPLLISILSFLFCFLKKRKQ